MQSSLLVTGLLQLFLLVQQTHSRSSGAANCISAASYSHGKDPEPGSGGFSLSVNSFSPTSTLALVSSRFESFRGVLIYINKGGTFRSLPPQLKYKTECDSVRGPHRTVSHINSNDKDSVSMPLVFRSEDEFDRIWDDCVVNAVIVVEFQKWFWINETCSNLFGAALGPAPATEEF